MRQRDLHPGFFDNPELSALGPDAQLLFAGLWCYADREGRLKDHPLRIRAAVFPYRPELDAVILLDALEGAGFIVRYEVDGAALVWIPTFKDHQHVHPRESASKIPPCPLEGTTKDIPRADLGVSITGGTSGLSSPSSLSDKSERARDELKKEPEPRALASLPPCLGRLWNGKTGTRFADGDEHVDAPTLISRAFERAFGMTAPADYGDFAASIHAGCLTPCDGSREQAAWCTEHIVEKLRTKAAPSWPKSRVLRMALEQDRRPHGEGKR